MGSLTLFRKYKNTFILLLLCPATAWAGQPADTLALTLDQAIATALKNSYEIEIAKNNVDANTILNNYGVAGGLPTVGINASNTEQITQVKPEAEHRCRDQS